MRYEETNPQDYELAKQAAPIAYLPWGAHEWHDNHNPLGLDTLKAHGMCSELCAETGGVVFPGVFCAHGTIKEPVARDCTLEFTRECVEILATEYLGQLSGAGFKVIVILMGHYGCEHIEAIREVVADFNETHQDSVAWAFADFDVMGSEGYLDAQKICFETSYMMYFRPELVDFLGLSEACMSSSAMKGRAAVNTVVKNASSKILELLDEKMHV
ncbi:MAG: creatininase family protein [Armatimonadota bacterium]